MYHNGHGRIEMTVIGSVLPTSAYNVSPVFNGSSSYLLHTVE